MLKGRAREAAWRQHRARLYRFVLGRVQDPTTAEDIVHDALLRGWRQRAQLRDEDKLEQWLYQITRNAVIDNYRERDRRPERQLPERIPDNTQNQDQDPLQEMTECLEPLLETLPSHYRRAVELAELGGLTQKETADRLGLSLSGAKSRIQRARSMLRENFLECCKIEVDSRGDIMDSYPRDPTS